MDSTYIIDQHDNEDNEIRRTNSSKWLKSSNASMAHLQHVKPMSVYNFGLANKKDLKATNLTSQRSNSYTNLTTEPVIQSVTSQKTAWGSNCSIPDLIKNSTKLTQRPGSATLSNRKHLLPTGKRQRPQSAKESVQPTKPGIAVKGAKYDPSGRPPKSFNSTTGWIGPPAGMKFADKDGVLDGVPPAPVGSPMLQIDVDLQSNLTEEDTTSPRLRYTHAEPQRTPTPPHIPPAPIHLMIPSMYDDVNDEQDEDELDTDRLLRMAEEHIISDKKAESVNNFVERVSSTEHSAEDLPGFTYTFVNGGNCQESKLEVHGKEGSEVLSWEKEEVNESYDFDFSDSECSEIITNTPRNESEQQHPHPLEKISVKFSEDKNVTIDITPRNTGHKVAELHRKKSNKMDDLDSVLSVSAANATEGQLSSRKKTVALTEMKHESKISRTLTNNKSYTKSEKPPGDKLEFNFTSHDSAKCEKSSLNNRPKSAINRPTTPLTSVTVAYCDLDNQKKKKRVRGPDKDIVTLVQQIQVSDSDEEKEEAITPHKLEPWMKTKSTSQKSKNYYEISRQSSKVSTKKVEKEDSGLETGAPLVKTIKTIELDEEGGDLKEIKSQSCIDRLSSTHLERDRQQREATRVRTKPRPASEMHNRNSSTKSEQTDKQHISAKHEPLKKPKRPFSAPSNKRPPISQPTQHSQKQHEVKTETPDIATEDGDVLHSCEFETNEVEKVTVETDKEPVSDHSYDHESANEEEVDRKTEKDLEIEKIIERHLGKPSQTVDLSEKQHKKTVKMSPQKSKSTAHSHGHCNCPTDSKKDKKPSEFTVQLPSSDKVSNKVYGAYARKKSAPPLRTLSKNKQTERPKTAKPVYITSKNPDDIFETEENLECQQLQAKLAANGVNIRAETLERALYPPSGRTKYYEINATLPKSSSSNLLSHPKEWLPIEYRQLKLAEKALNRANEIMYRQRVAEDRKARLTEMAKSKVKGKKKGKAKTKKKEEKAV